MLQKEPISFVPNKRKIAQKTKSNMVRKTHQGGINTIGSAKAGYFCPSKYIDTKFPNDYKTLRLENVTIVHDGTVQVNHKEQRCYFVNIEGINSTLYIVVKISELTNLLQLFLKQNAKWQICQ